MDGGSGLITVGRVVGEELTVVPQLARTSSTMATAKFVMILLSTNPPDSLPHVKGIDIILGSVAGPRRSASGFGGFLCDCVMKTTIAPETFRGNDSCLERT